MAIRKIAQLGHPILRRVADPVTAEVLASAGFQALIDDLIETQRDADGAGIAAPQVHESLRVCVMEVKANPRYPSLPAIPLTVLVNPVITPLVPVPPAPGQAIVMYEGCLSVVGLRGRVRRPRHVRVRALGRHGESVELEFVGPPAAVVQHECDHLDGVLFVDRAEPGSLLFLREFERFVPPADRLIDEGA